MRYRLLVFDWDGTIIDSAATIAECIREASRVIGLGLHDAMRLAVPDLPPARYPEFVALYRRHFLAREDSMDLFAGMRELLGTLSENRLLAIATGKSRRGLDRALAATGVRGCFSASRCADETSPKPAPAMLLELIEELNTPARQVLMIGDTSHDMEMARAAGVDALAVSYGAHPEQGLVACGPRACVPSVGALRAWLKLHA